MASALVLLQIACNNQPKAITDKAGNGSPILEVMAVDWGLNLKFDEDFWRSFGKRNGMDTHFVSNTRLSVYRQLLGQHASEPELLQLDIVWPAIVADDLLDLRPYLKKEDISAFPAELLENYTVRGRLVALPIYVDIGLLFYRPELLEKYGFRKPPETWDELEMMAARIQAGERRKGNKKFWGYVWQGAASEGGTCNALEWQASAGAGNFIEASGVNVRNDRFLKMLKRTTGWEGTISPPGEYVYQEDDSVNVWDNGQTAFMRNWASGYGHVAAQPGGDRKHFGVAPMPAGAGGHRGTLGGVGLGISRYAAHRESSIRALLDLTSEGNDIKRSFVTQGIPTRTAVCDRADIKVRSPLLAMAGELMKSGVSRPSLLAAEKYDAASGEYAMAFNSVLRRKATPEDAMAALEKKLMVLTGRPSK